MTPERIRDRIAKASQAELRRIVDEIKAYPPVDAADLLRVCRGLQADITAATRRLHDDRSAVSKR